MQRFRNEPLQKMLEEYYIKLFSITLNEQLDNNILTLSETKSRESIHFHCPLAAILF